MADRKTLVKGGREVYVDSPEAEAAFRKKGFVGADEVPVKPAEEEDEPEPKKPAAGKK